MCGLLLHINYYYVNYYYVYGLLYVLDYGIEELIIRRSYTWVLNILSEKCRWSVERSLTPKFTIFSDSFLSILTVEGVVMAVMTSHGWDFKMTWKNIILKY